MATIPVFGEDLFLDGVGKCKRQAIEKPGFVDGLQSLPGAGLVPTLSITARKLRRSMICEVFYFWNQQDLVLKIALPTLLHRDGMYIFPPSDSPRYRPNGETGRRMGLKIPRS